MSELMTHVSRVHRANEDIAYEKAYDKYLEDLDNYDDAKKRLIKNWLPALLQRAQPRPKALYSKKFC